MNASKIFPRLRNLVLMVALSFECLGVVAAPRPVFKLTDLGVIPGVHSSYASKIANAGHVIGTAVSVNSTQPFVYRNGVISVIADGTDYAMGQDINDRGELLLWNPRSLLVSGASIAELRTAAGEALLAYSLNNLGQVAGAIGAAGTVERAFIYSDGGFRFYDGLAPGESSRAFDTNDLGQAVGFSTVPLTPEHAAGVRAVIFQDNHLIDLGVLPGGNMSFAAAINDSFQVVGYSDTSSGLFHAFLYTRGQMLDLGTLRGDLGSEARDINGAGQVVGFSYPDSAGPRAFLYADGVMYNLNDLVKPRLAFTLITANGINDWGQIVGTGLLPNGSPRAFLLTPVRRPRGHGRD